MLDERGRITVILLAALSAVLLTIVLIQNLRPQPASALRTPYQAILLTNGQAFYGKLEQLGSPFPVLRDVYYIQSQVNPETKQVSNTLVKRGKELHAPDVTLLNANNILIVESVGPDSQVTKLIEELKKK